MLIKQMSDLHLEFNQGFRVRNTSGADLLMLNGDICVIDYFNRSAASPYHDKARNVYEFFKTASEEFKNVVLILGNHEFYHGYYQESVQHLREVLAEFKNIHILHNGVLDIEDFRILGTTLWTSCNNANPLVVNHLAGAMNDFKLITKRKEPFQKFLPMDSVRAYLEAVRFLSAAVETHDNIIVMTHHAPSYDSIHSNYRNSNNHLTNYGYFSDLDFFIAENPQIKLWTHGHVHNNFDYMIGSTRIVCNPHGYGKENLDNFNEEGLIHV
jgi:predicted phosphohydrolase